MITLHGIEELSCGGSAGQSFCKARIEEIYENAECGLSESLIEEIIWFLHQNEDTKHVDSFLKALPSLQPNAVNSLLLTPLLQEHMDEVNCLRYGLFQVVLYWIVVDVLVLWMFRWTTLSALRLDIWSRGHSLASK